MERELKYIFSFHLLNLKQKTYLYETWYEIIKSQCGWYNDVTNDIILHKKRFRYEIR